MPRLIQEHVAELLHFPEDLSKAHGAGVLSGKSRLMSSKKLPVMQALDPYVARSF